MENCVQLWEILVDLHLTYLDIELCFLQCFEGDDQSKQSIINRLHQKCIKMEALEAYRDKDCNKCVENEQLLILSNFPLLIHCVTENIDVINIYEKLIYLWYMGIGSQISPTVNCNLQELCIQSDKLALSDSFMSTLSAHGGLVHVILSVHFVTQNGIASLIENSLNLQNLPCSYTSWCCS